MIWNSLMLKSPKTNCYAFLIGVLGIALGIIGVQFAEQLNWIKFFDNVHWTFGTFFAAVLAWLGYYQAPTLEIANIRRWFALGFSGYALGQLIWDIQIFFNYQAFPAPSDLFYLCLGPCQLWALILEIRAHQKKSHHKFIFLDTLALSTAALTLVLVLYLPKRGNLDLLSLMVLIAYPVSLLIVISTELMTIPSLRLRISNNLLLFIFTSMITAWSWMRWNLLALTGETIDGDIWNASFSIAILLAGFSISFRQIEISKQARWDLWCEIFLRFLPLVNVLLACITMIVVSTEQFGLGLEQGLTLIGAIIVILLAIIRQAVLLQEHEQLLATQSLLRTVLDTVPIRVFWKDKQSRYLGCNTAFAKDAGLKNTQAVIGKTDYQMNWQQQAEQYQADDQQVMQSKQAKLNYEEPQYTADGQMIYLRTSKVPLLNSQNDVIGILGVYDDITLLKKYQDKLMLTAKVFDNTEESIMITNAEQQLIDVNQAFCKITGYSREEVLGKNPRILKSGYHDDKFYRQMWQSITKTGHWHGELWSRKKNGDIYPKWITISAITDDTGTVTNYVGIFSDISLLKQQEKQLEHIAHYDALTGVPNRVLLVDRMKQAIAQAKRSQKLLMVCFLDLDGFKPINDTYGHHIGDQVLIKFSERVLENIRETDTLARLGGDEFVLLLQDLDKIQDCIHKVEQLLNNIAEPININKLSLTITASIGITIYPLDDQEADALLRHADYAMYKVKKSGKNGYLFYDADADQIEQNRQLYLQEIAYGITENQFELFYQPKVDMNTHQVIGAEALIRWRHPNKGLLSPILFLSAMENTPLEVTLGDWVIEHALKQLSDWRALGLELIISVNITGQQLLEVDFIDKLEILFAKYPNVPAHLLEFEILESTALEIERSCQVIMTACSKLGVSFALDDFGTGYSSLAYLKQLPVSTLKVDQTFVRDMLDDLGDYAIVEAVIALAKVFDRKIVAEGVETEQHFAELQKMGCQIAQGFGIAKPMPAAQFYDWYQQRQS